MKISEAAKLTDLNVSSIRFYERKGLLMPQREDGSKYRDYTDEDVQRIRQILLYRKMGISVETIELILKGKAVPGEILAEQKRVLEEQITELKGASELCKLVMKEAEIPENKKLEEYLNYVYQEEKKGGRFAEVPGASGRSRRLFSHSRSVGDFLYGYGHEKVACGSRRCGSFAFYDCYFWHTCMGCYTEYERTFHWCGSDMGNVGGCLWNRIFKLFEEQELTFNRSAQALFPVNLTVQHKTLMWMEMLLIL